MILDDKNFILGVFVGGWCSILADMLFNGIVYPLVDKVKTKVLSKRNSDTKPE